MPPSHPPSSFNGIIEELIEVAIDNFTDCTCQAYLLSHCHADHTSGLYSEELLKHLRSNDVLVYMSEPSAAIVAHESGGSEIVKYIKALPIGTTTISIPGNPLTDDEPHYIGITLIPAGHCWGSVMFLINTLYKTVLYTGDFRMHENSLEKYAQLHDEKGDVIEIDALYVDTTFYSPLHQVFPSRSDSVSATHTHIHTWLAHSERNRVALHTSARYGYEFVFNQMYEKLGQKVYVPDDIWKLYSRFPSQVKGVTNESSTTRIHLCRNRTETKPHDGCLANHCANDKYLFIHFSALKWTNYDIEDNMLQVKKDANNYRIDVCFATHCSYTELEYFISYLNPDKIVGFPNKYEKKSKMVEEKLVAESEQNLKSKCEETEDSYVVDEETWRKVFDDDDDDNDNETK